MEDRWARPELTPEVQKTLIDSVHAEVGSRSIEALEAERDELLLGLIELRNKTHEAAAPPASRRQLRSPQMITKTATATQPVETDRLTQILRAKLANSPSKSSDFDLHAAVDDVLKDVGLSAKDSGGALAFYGRDPIIPSAFRFGSAAAIGLAAKAVAVAMLWRSRTGEGQDIAVDVRKALRRFAGFLDLKWELINGRPPALDDPLNPFIGQNLFSAETRDGRHVVAINIYPRLAARAFELLRCRANAESLNNAILQWRAEKTSRTPGADAGLPIATVRTFEEFEEGAPVHRSALEDAAHHRREDRRERADAPSRAMRRVLWTGFGRWAWGTSSPAAPSARDLAYYNLAPMSSMSGQRR